MNPVLMIVYNNLNLTRDAVASVFAQDIPVYLTLVANGCTDGTAEWARSLDVPEPHEMEVIRYDKNTSPVKVANFLIGQIFKTNEYVLCVPNDVILPVNMFSQLLRFPRGVVTASQTDMKFNVSGAGHVAKAVNECTPLAVCLVRRWAYEALMAKDGYLLDEKFFFYASDCDFALRLAACGIRGVQTDLTFWHHCSASHRLAPRAIGDEMRAQADRDRDYFRQKHGFTVDSPQYGEAARDINFRG